MATLAFTIDDLLTPLALFGFAGQFVFMLRFVVQWYASERRRRSYVPIGFWYLSIAGGLMLLVYATFRQDPVFMFGQVLGLLIYVRNLVLIYRRRDRAQRALKVRTGRSLASADRPARPLLGEGIVEEDAAQDAPEVAASPARGSG